MKNLTLIAELNNRFGERVDVLNKVFTEVCAWRKGKCTRDSYTSCCQYVYYDPSCGHYQHCKHLTQDGCKLEQSKPMLCKLYLCDEAKYRFRSIYPEVYQEYVNICNEIGDGMNHLRDEWRHVRQTAR